ncbi:hypothetical protein DFS34DRAFT_652039 [Phlyctochytrium arcticum]|nr:hypothetical protein DFS34DRAFT_652039 [Phlyctochytrium arcticum]
MAPVNANFYNNAGERIASIYASTGLRHDDMLLYLSILTSIQPREITAQYDVLIGRAGNSPLDPTTNIPAGIYRILPKHWHPNHAACSLHAMASDDATSVAHPKGECEFCELVNIFGL